MLLAENFNPLPRKEEDEILNKELEESEYFNPLPRKEGDRWQQRGWNLCRFQSTPS